MIPFDSKLTTLISGPVACGKTTALCHIMANSPLGSWIIPYNMGEVTISRRLLAVTRREDIRRGWVEDSIEAIRKHIPPFVAVDDIHQHADLHRSARSHLIDLLVACKSSGTGLAVGLQTRRPIGLEDVRPSDSIADLFDSVWVSSGRGTYDKIQFRCVRGPYEGNIVTLPSPKIS